MSVAKRSVDPSVVRSSYCPGDLLRVAFVEYPKLYHRRIVYGLLGAACYVGMLLDGSVLVDDYWEERALSIIVCRCHPDGTYPDFSRSDLFNGFLSGMRGLELRERHAKSRTCSRLA